jgi:tetratricopeptide (TPR) repeat protein
MTKKLFILLALIFVAVSGGTFWWLRTTALNGETGSETLLRQLPEEVKIASKKVISLSETKSIEPVQLPPTPDHDQLENEYHVFQTFNNCGPASLSMALSYYGITASQQQLGQELRPYQHPTGDNDDKSVTLEELAQKASEYDLVAFYRPNGSIQLLEHLVANGMPVITRTWLTVDNDIGHYRVVKGYNRTTQQLLQDDSLQGKNIWYSYTDFEKIWQKFNYEYVVLVPRNKVAVVETLLGQDVDGTTAWRRAAETARRDLEKSPADATVRFNLSVALYNSGEYDAAIAEFEKVEHQLPFRTLWYQIEPIKAYFAVGNFDRVLALTESILNTHNRAFTELYILRGDVFMKQRNPALAREEYEKAVFYNRNSKEAWERLESLE